MEKNLPYDFIFFRSGCNIFYFPKSKPKKKYLYYSFLLLLVASPLGEGEWGPGEGGDGCQGISLEAAQNFYNAALKSTIKSDIVSEIWSFRQI